MRFGMIADDVTGACDAGVQFAARGFSAQVWVDTEAMRPAAELTVLSTNSRKENPDRARSLVAAACAALRRHGIDLVYKKIDSTLLGNIGPELEAALDGSGCAEAWVSPAFPAMGRTVRDGWLSARPVHLPTLLKEQSADPRLRPFDAATQPELAAIARAAVERPHRALLAGSAGLAIELAALLAERFGKHPKPSLPGRPGQGPVVLVIGSVNPVTVAQVVYLKRCRPGRHIVMHVTWKAGELDHLPDVLRSSGARGLVFSGGDTAGLACWVLKAAGIRLDREILTGIPYGSLAGGPFDGMPVVTKAGGFGREDALAVVADSLT